LLNIFLIFILFVLFQGRNSVTGTTNESFIQLDENINRYYQQNTVDNTAASDDIDVDDAGADVDNNDDVAVTASFSADIDVDATSFDAFREYEDNIGDTASDNEETPEEATESLPNNDFYFSEADFLHYRTSMNDATQHQSKHTLTWDVIKNLSREKVKYSSIGDGYLTWKAMEGV